MCLKTRTTKNESWLFFHPAKLLIPSIRKATDMPGKIDTPKFHIIYFYKFVLQSDGEYFDLNMYLIDVKSLDSL